MKQIKAFFSILNCVRSVTFEKDLRKKSLLLSGKTRKGRGRMNILSVRNLKKYYEMGENTVKALDGVDLDIEEGEFLAIVGTSGSGKSTLLHMLGGLDNPTSGEVWIDGKDISKLSRDELTIFRRRKIGFVFQNYNLLPLMNVYENIVLPVKLDGLKPDEDYVDEINMQLSLRMSRREILIAGQAKMF